MSSVDSQRWRLWTWSWWLTFDWINDLQQRWGRQLEPIFNNKNTPLFSLLKSLAFLQSGYSLGTRLSSSCSWILDSSSDVNLHLFTAAGVCCSWCCCMELFLDFDDGGTARHEVGIEPVTIPSGNFLQSTLRPGNKLAFLDMNAVTAS